MAYFEKNEKFLYSIKLFPENSVTTILKNSQSEFENKIVFKTKHCLKK